MKGFKAEKRRLIYSFVFSVLFAAGLIWGHQLSTLGYTSPGVRGKLITLILSILLALPFSAIVYFALGWLKTDSKEKIKGLRKWTKKKFFLVCGVIFLCWIPVFLAYFPAVMAYDTNVQLLQALWGVPYFSSQHPQIHTLFIWICVTFGEAVNSYEAGMAMYSIIQMLLLSASLSYATGFVYRLSGKMPAILSFAFFAFFPYISILSVSVTKDVPFSAFVLVFTLLIAERFCFENVNIKRLNVYTVFFGVLVIIFRKNAIFAMTVLLIMAVLLLRGKERKSFLLLLLGVFVAGVAALGIIKLTLEYFVGNGIIEVLGVPIQQMARVGNRHGAKGSNDMSNEDYELLNKYIPEEYWENYNPATADTVKFGIMGSTEAGGDGTFFDMTYDWVKLGMHYPNEYLDAFLALTKGYWDIFDDSFANSLGAGADIGKGVLYTFNASDNYMLDEEIKDIPVLPGFKQLLNRLVNDDICLKIPLLRILFQPAFYVWIILFGIMNAMYKRDKKQIVMYGLLTGNFLTLLLGPTVLVRYAFPMILAFPVILSGLKHTAQQSSR
ncbi:MAG: hypothetical protein IJ608_03310 [Lachnospiraceae bacterium]|nr:hypothetical protein [Lachnospiraceae bacterium]